MKPHVELVKQYGGAIGRTYKVTDDLGAYHFRKGWLKGPNVGRRGSWRELRKDWRDRIRICDVLRTRRNDFRVVRNCLFSENGYLISVEFAIKHCSWTHQCYTVYNRTDLKIIGYRPTGLQHPLDHPIDKKIFASMMNTSPDFARLDCCDVKGVP